MTQKELDVILEKHKKWLNNEEGGEKANLLSADLSYADLSSADLRSADLSYANLRSANLRSANLLSADLSSADLSSANLRSANLRSADLSSANLSSADLSYADLSSADLRSADLRSADLSSADLRSANLRSANLSYANNLPYIPMACPDTNGFTGFKKVRMDKVYIIELYIPASAKRSSATGRKCRCESAKVKKIEVLEKGECKATDVKTVVNDSYGHKTAYTIGETVYPDSYDENRFNECSNGIHFFINKQEAIDY